MKACTSYRRLYAQAASNLHPYQESPHHEPELRLVPVSGLVPQDLVPARADVPTSAVLLASRVRRKDPNNPGRYVCDTCGQDFTAKHNLQSTPPIMNPSFASNPAHRPHELAHGGQKLQMQVPAEVRHETKFNEARSQVSRLVVRSHSRRDGQCLHISALLEVPLRTTWGYSISGVEFQWTPGGIKRSSNPSNSDDSRIMELLS
ncbi:hypothetical protein B0H17DRAFT_639157 [Mycena rosella]|uniref:Uncharacterized protein n=1 Tax=Mycena rosella TaxID=1033263 RepID=A0AAD7DEB3_MYCRO|nr:hypothetical protein B0H17DRAFT_639157 [Mycena rosella]